MEWLFWSWFIGVNSSHLRSETFFLILESEYMSLKVRLLPLFDSKT